MPRGGTRAGAGRPKGQGKFGEKTKPVRIPLSMVDNVLSFIKNNDLSLPIYSNKVTAGFPSPADDHIEGKLDLNTHLIKHPSATFCVRVTGESMRNAGIFSGDVMVIDRALEPKNNSIVLAVLNGEFTVKRICKKGSELYLKPENKHFQSIQINEEMDFQVWGVVTHVIHKV